MLNWVEHWFKSGASFITRKALDWIHVALHAIAGVIETVFSGVTHAWLDLQHATWWIFNEVRYGARLFYHFVWWVTNKGIPDLFAYAYKLGKALWHGIDEAYKWASGEIHKAIKYAERYANDIWSWGYSHFIKPIERSIYEAWQWINHDGAYIWHVITHPADLADIVLAAMAGAFMRASDKVLSAIGMAVLHTVLKQMPRMLHIIEDIFASIL